MKWIWRRFVNYRMFAYYYDMFVDEDLNDQYVSIIKEYKQSGDVLDLGCGTGKLSVQLALNGYFVTATDISTDMLDVGYHNALMNDVRVQYFVHDILDTVNRDYDIIVMSSDVINYMNHIDDVKKAFENVSLAMNSESIFVFDTLRHDFVKKLDGHHEELLLPDNVFIWDVVGTNLDGQIKHNVKIGTETEIHHQRAFQLKEYNRLLDEVGLKVIKKVKNEDRFILVCKKEM